jgi:WD40 repeat protein
LPLKQLLSAIRNLDLRNSISLGLLCTICFTIRPATAQEDAEFVFDRIAKLSVHRAQLASLVVKEHLIYSGDQGGTIAKSSAKDGTLVWQHHFKKDGRVPDPVTAMSISGTGKLIVVALKSASLCTVNTDTAAVISCWQTPQSSTITSIDLASDGIFAVTGDDMGRLLRWNLLTQESEVLGVYDWPIITVRFRSDDRVLAGDGKTLALWNIQDPKQERVIIKAGESTSDAFWFEFLGFSNDLGQAVGCSGDKVLIFDLSNGQQIGKLINSDTGRPFKSATLTPDMTELITTDMSGQVIVWDTATWQPKAKGLALQFGFVTHFTPLTEPGHYAIAGTYINIPAGFTPEVSIWNYKKVLHGQ